MSCPAIHVLPGCLKILTPDRGNVFCGAWTQGVGSQTRLCPGLSSFVPTGLQNALRGGWMGR